MIWPPYSYNRLPSVVIHPLFFRLVPSIGITQNRLRLSSIKPHQARRRSSQVSHSLTLMKRGRTRKRKQLSKRRRRKAKQLIHHRRPMRMTRRRLARSARRRRSVKRRKRRQRKKRRSPPTPTIPIPMTTVAVVSV